MKKLFFSLLIAVAAIGFSAFTVEKNNKQLHLGIVEVDNDGGGKFYIVEPYGTEGRACDPELTAECSFEWDGGTLPMDNKIYADDPQIVDESLVTGFEYR